MGAFDDFENFERHETSSRAAASLHVDSTRSPLELQSALKQRRIAANADRLNPVQTSLEELGGAGSDADNIGVRQRLGYGEDGKSYNAWETEKPPEFYQKFPQTIEVLAKQRVLLDDALGLERGTSTVQDVWNQGAKAKEAMDARYAANAGADGQVPLSSEQFGVDDYGRKLLNVKFADGKNVVDGNNTQEFNANYGSRFNRTKLAEDNAAKFHQALTGADGKTFSDEDIESNMGKSALNTVQSGAGILSQGLGMAATAIPALKKQADDTGISQSGREMYQSIVEAEKEGKPLTQEQNDFVNGKASEGLAEVTAKNREKRIDQLLSNGSDDGSMTREDAGNIVDSSDNFLRAERARKEKNESKKARILDRTQSGDGESEYRKLQRQSNLTETIGGIRKSFSTISDKVNTSGVDRKNRQLEKDQRTDAHKAKTNYDKAIKDSDIMSGLKSAFYGAKTGLKSAKHSVLNPGATGKELVDSIAEYGLHATTYGTYTAAKAIDLTDVYGDAYKKNHGGKKAEGKDALKIAAGSLAQSLLERGSGELMFGGIAKKIGLVKTKDKFEVDMTNMRGGKGRTFEKGSLKYDVYAPASLANIKGKKADNSLLGAEYLTAVDKITPKVIRQGMEKTAFRKLVNMTKQLGTTPAEFIKRGFLAAGAMAAADLRKTKKGKILLGGVKGVTQLTKGAVTGAKGAGVVAKGASAEYLEEGATSVLEQSLNHLGTDKELDLYKAHIAGLTGFGLGASVSGARNAIPIAKEVTGAVFNQKTANEKLQTRVEKAIHDQEPVGIREQVKATADPDSFRGKYEAAKDLAERVDLVSSKETVIAAAKGSTQDKADYVSASMDDYTELSEQAIELDAQGDTEGAKALFEKVKSLGGSIATVNQLLEADKAKATIDKETSEVGDSDLIKAVSSGLVSGETKAKKSKETFKKIDEAIANGQVSKSVAKAYKALRKITKNIGTEEMKRVSSEILMRPANAKQGDKGKSLYKHIADIEQLVADGNSTQALTDNKALKSFAKTIRLKKKMFTKLQNGEIGNSLEWGKGKNKKTYYKDSVGKVLATVKEESKILDAHVVLSQEVIRTGIQAQKTSNFKKKLVEIQANLASKGFTNTVTPTNADGINKDVEVEVNKPIAKVENDTAIAEIKALVKHDKVHDGKRISTKLNDVAMVGPIGQFKKLRFGKEKLTAPKLLAKIARDLKTKSVAEVTESFKDDANSTALLQSYLSESNSRLDLKDGNLTHSEHFNPAKEVNNDKKTKKEKKPKKSKSKKETDKKVNADVAEIKKKASKGKKKKKASKKSKPNPPKEVVYKGKKQKKIKPAEQNKRELLKGVTKLLGFTPTKHKLKKKKHKLAAKVGNLQNTLSPTGSLKGSSKSNQRLGERNSFENAKVRDTDGLSSWLADLAPDDTTKTLIEGVAAFMRKNHINLPVNTFTNIDADGKKTSNIPAFTGMNSVNFLMSNDTRKGETSFSYASALHEMMHAALQYKLDDMADKNDPIIKELNDLMKLADTASKEKFGNNFVYGLKDIHEFLAELSNPKFREFLATVEDPNAIESTDGLLTRVVKLFNRAVKKILTDGSYKDKNVLASAVKITDLLLEGELANTTSTSAESLQREHLFGALNSKAKGKKFYSNIFSIRNKVASSQLGNIPNFFATIKDVIQDKETSDAAAEGGNTLVKFHKKILKNLDRAYANFNPEKINKFSIEASPALAFMADGDINNMPENVKSAIAVEIKKFLYEGAGDTLFNDNATVRKLIGLAAGAPIDSVVGNTLRTIGTPHNTLRTRIGEGIMSQLNISESKDADQAYYYEKMVDSLGTMALNTMEDAKLVQFFGAKGKDIDLAKPKKDRKSDAKAYTVYVKAANKWDADKGYFTLSDTIVALNENYKNGEADFIQAHLNNKIESIKEPETKPVTKISRAIKRTFSQMTETYHGALSRMGKEKWHFDYNKLDAFHSLDPHIARDILGYKNPDDHLDYYSESIIGKNGSIDRDMLNLKEYSETNTTNNKGAFYLPLTVWKNFRMGYISNRINVQQSKLHRQMVVSKDWETTVDMSDAKQMEQFRQSVGLLYGGSVDFNTIHDGSKFLNEDVQKAVDIINDGGNFSGAVNGNILKKAIDNVGEGMMGFTALHTLASYQNALNSKKKEFSFTGYVEIDGITNGTSTANLQTMQQYDEEAKIILRASGMYVVGDDYKSSEHYFKFKDDNYEGLIQGLFEKASEVPDTVENKALKKLTDLVGASIIEDGEVTPSGRNFAKPYVMTFIYSKGAESMSRDVENEIYEQIMDYIDVNKDTKKGRKELKKLVTAVNELVAIKANKLRQGNNHYREFSIPDLHNMSKKDLKSFQLKPSIVSYDMADQLKDNITNPLLESLEENFAQIAETRRTVNAAVTDAYAIAKAIYDYEIKEAEKAKYKSLGEPTKYASGERVPLNRAEYEAFMKEQIAAGYMPTIKHASSTDHTDSLFVKATEGQKVDDAQGGGVEHPTPNKPSIFLIDEIMRDGTASSITEVNNASMSGNIKADVFSGEVGVKVFVGLVLAMDGNQMAESMADPDQNVIHNIHDAYLLKAGNLEAQGSKINDQYLKLNERYHLLDEVQSTYDRMVKLRRKYLNVDDKALQQALSGLFDKDTATDLKEARLGNNAARRRIYSESEGITHVGQFATGFDGHEVNDNDRKTFRNIEEASGALNESFKNIEEGASADPGGTRKDNTVAHVILNAKQVHSINKGLKRADAVSPNAVDKNHQKHLDDYITGTLTELLRSADTINYSSYTTHKANTGLFEDNSIYQQVSTNVNRSSIESTAQQTFAKQLTHALWEHGIKNDKTMYAKVNKLYKQVMKDNLFTVADFYPKDSNGSITINERKRALREFTEIFDSNDIANFSAHAMTHPVLLAKLENYKITRVNKSDSIDNTPLDYLRDYTSDLVKATTVKKSGNKYLNDLAQGITHITEEKVSFLKQFNPFSEKLNKSAADFQAEVLVKPVVKWFKEHPVLYPAITNNTARKVMSPLRFVYTGGIYTVQLLGNPDLAKLTRRVGNKVHEATTTFIVDMFKEGLGTQDRDRPFHTLLRHAKHYTEAVHKRLAEGTTKDIKDRFSPRTAMNAKKWRAVTQGVLRTDLGSIMHHHLKDGELLELFDRGQLIDNHVRALEARIEKANPNSKVQLHYAKNLAHYMVTHRAGSNNLKMNAYSIAKQFHKESTFSDELVEDLDHLISLYAIKNLDPKDAERAQTIIKSEFDNNDLNNGIIYITDMVKMTEGNQLQNVLHGDRSLMVKGGVQESKTASVGHRMVLLDSPSAIKSNKILEHKGYTLVEHTITRNKQGKRVGMYINKSMELQRYMAGIVNLTDPSIDVNEDVMAEFDAKINQKINNGSTKLDFTRTYRIPSADGTSSSYQPDLNAWNDHLSGNQDAANLVGDFVGSTNTQYESKNHNEELVDLLADDYNQYKLNGNTYEKDQFIKISADHKKYGEVYKLLPEYFRESMDLSQGTVDSFYINKDHINLVLGFRKKTLTNLFPNAPENVAIIKSKKFVYHAEEIWQAVVSTSKNNIVILTPKVLVSNVVSNAVLMTVNGVPPDYMIKKKTEALKHIGSYRKDIIKLDKLKRDRNAVNIRTSMTEETRDRKIARLEQALRNNPVAPLVDEGIYTTITEDINFNDTPLMRSLSNAFNAVSTDKTTKTKDTLEDLETKDRLYAVTAYKTAVIAPDTGLAKNLREATQVSDFVARYATYKYRTEEQGKGHQESIDEVMDTFVNYDWNTNANMQWLNDMGILMYTKFLFRIQKVIFNQFKDRPINAYASLVAQKAIYDVPDISTSNIFANVHTGKIQDPVEVFDNAFELNLLHYLRYLVP